MLDVTKIREGKFNGVKIWICHYNRPDLYKKPLRNVPPTEVIVRPLSELPKNKRVYYSEVFFSPLKKSGEVSSKIISPVDNTGFRSACGNELLAFDNEKDCIHSWNIQLNGVILRINEKAAAATNSWVMQAEKLDDMKVNN